MTVTVTVTVTEAEVVWCYRTLLGRDPESAQVVQQKLALAKDLQSLIMMFIDCQEYRQKHGPGSMVPLNCPPMHIEAVTSPHQLSLLKNRIRETWTHLGEVRRHHSVLTGKEYLPQSMSNGSVDSFYASGVHEAETIGAMLGRFAFSRAKDKICVEYGCGLGRVTLAFAKMFKVVHGYDISSSHLALARSRALDTRITNVKFHLCSAGSIVEELRRCDFFYSRLVFQHNPPPLMRELIAAALRSLRVAGVGIFQLPTYMTGYTFRIKEYLASERSHDMEMHCLPQSEILSLITENNCKLLELREDGSVGHDGRWISNMFVVQRVANRVAGSSRGRPIKT